MSIREEEEALFEQWKQNREGFVKDGIISETDYLNSNPKIALILKEVNDTKDNGGWDLRPFVLDGARPRTWDNVARWVHGIRNLDSVKVWDFYSNVTNDFRIEWLKGICAINLKKSPGGHTADMRSLSVVANEDKEFIQRQYGIYDPDLTICAGTGDLFRSVLGQSSVPWRMTERGIRWYERETKKYVVSFAHPEARVQSSLLVYGLLDAVREIYA